MGRDKALLEIGGQTLLARAVALLEPLVAPIRLVGDAQRNAAGGVASVPDRWPGAGPLGGIASGLAAADKKWCVVLACDMPFVTSNWIEWLLDCAGGSRADAIIPNTVQGLEPLCAVYRAGCAARLAAALDRGLRKVTDGLAGLNLDLASEDIWRRFSPNGFLFRNLNTWEDYVSAKKQLES